MLTLGDIADIHIGPFGSLLHKDDYILGGHALVNPSHIIDGKIVIDPKLTVSNEKYMEMAAYHLKKSDVVLGRRGEMGRCAVVRKNGLICGTGSMILRCKGRIEPYLLQKIISSSVYKGYMEAKSVGVTMMNLNVPMVSELKIPALPVDLQNQFITFVHQIDKSKVVSVYCLNSLQVVRKNGIMNLSRRGEMDRDDQF